MPQKPSSRLSELRKWQYISGYMAGFLLFMLYVWAMQSTSVSSSPVASWRFLRSAGTHLAVPEGWAAATGAQTALASSAQQLPGTETNTEAATATAPRVFVGVLSRAANAAARQAVRDTWGADPRWARVMFFSLRPASNETWRQLRLEAAQYGDIIVTSEVAENYNKITHSTLAIFRAAVAIGNGVTHILKTDEDCYVRASLLLEDLQGLPQQWLHAGYPWTSFDVAREITAPPQGLEHVRYGFGWGYVVTMDIARHFAAGVPHVLSAPDQPPVAEDHAAGYWVAYLAQELNVSIAYGGVEWRGRYPPCEQEVVTHLSGKSHLLRCMHAKGGACCE